MWKALCLFMLLAASAQAAARLGESSPAFDLPRIQGEGSVSLASLQGHPVVLWFPDIGAQTRSALTTMLEVIGESKARLVVIPVVGSDRQSALPLAEACPTATLLHDSDGRVTAAYTGEFIAGIAPRQNLFLVDSAGKLRGIRVYPGIPRHKLVSLLTELP